jgi:hypothetical protein
VFLKNHTELNSATLVITASVDFSSDSFAEKSG